MRSLRAISWRQRRLLVATVLLVSAIILLGFGLGGLALGNKGDSDAIQRASLDLPRNGLDTPTATPVPTPTPSSASVVRMIIEKIGLDAPVVTMGLDANNVPLVPNNPNDVVWYDFSSRPGWGSNAVFSGHVDWTINGVPVTGVFYSLRQLQTGDIIKVRLADNIEYQYRVSKNDLVPFDSPEAVAAMGATPTDTVTIITCGGTFVRIPGDPLGGNYTHRQIVRAERLYGEPAAPTAPAAQPARSGREIP